MICLKKVNAENIWDILSLSVDEGQKSFVADNKTSIIEAYLTLEAGGFVCPMGIFEDETPVGFLMIGCGTDDSWENPPQIAENNYNLWRFMIDYRYQKKGFGKKALQLVLDYIRTEPFGKAEYCWLSYEPENTVAKKLYSSFGFAETGEWDGNECIAVLKL
ncbi:MAG: GNAT family N-acetyltransferase [Christensenellaceae bacterium]|nr:GNAT family N-acetyltransferase [Christensenellaceae bacterium]